MTEQEQPRFGHVAVVIPCYNVAPHIETVIRGIPSWVQTIVCVDDRSPDDSAARILQLHDPRVILVRNEKNLGVGGAVRRGYEECLRQHADVIVKMDGDDQMDPRYLPALVEPLLRGEADYSKGNRWCHSPAALSNQSENNKREGHRPMPRLRRLGNLALSFFTKAASGYWRIFDPCNGYTAIRASVLSLLDLECLARDYYFETSMLVELNKAGAVVVDVSMPARYGQEKSSLRIKTILARFPLALTRSFCSRIWYRHFIKDFGPFAVFFFFGLVLMFGSLLFGGWHWLQSLRSGVPATAGTVMLAALPFLMGFQLLVQAMVIDMSHSYSEPLCKDQKLFSPIVPASIPDHRQAA
jgi:glycosyltransferase involved in cell wall biosynthesis